MSRASREANIVPSALLAFGNTVFGLIVEAIDRAWIDQHNIQLVVHGDDYSQEYQEDVYKVPIEMGIFRVVPYTRSISTTEIIRRCKQARLN